MPGTELQRRPGEDSSGGTNKWLIHPILVSPTHSLSLSLSFFSPSLSHFSRFQPVSLSLFHFWTKSRLLNWLEYKVKHHVQLGDPSCASMRLFAKWKHYAVFLLKHHCVVLLPWSYSFKKKKNHCNFSLTSNRKNAIPANDTACLAGLV